MATRLDPMDYVEDEGGPGPSGVPWLRLTGWAAVGLVLLVLAVRMAGCALSGGVRYFLRLQDATGVVEDGPVVHKGHRIGRVAEVEIRGGAVVAEVVLEEEAASLVRVDARWGLGSAPVLGASREVVLLDPGAGAAAPEGHAFDTEPPSWLSRLVDPTILSLAGFALALFLVRPLLSILATILGWFRRGA